MKDKWLRIGLGGTLVTALCCFTPILVWGLAGVGLVGVIGYLDLVLLPGLVIFLMITGVALWLRMKKT